MWDLASVLFALVSLINAYKDQSPDQTRLIVVFFLIPDIHLVVVIVRTQNITNKQLEKSLLGRDNRKTDLFF